MAMLWRTVRSDKIILIHRTSSASSAAYLGLQPICITSGAEPRKENGTNCCSLQCVLSRKNASARAHQKWNQRSWWRLKNVFFGTSPVWVPPTVGQAPRVSFFPNGTHRRERFLRPLAYDSVLPMVAVMVHMVIVPAFVNGLKLIRISWRSGRFGRSQHGYGFCVGM